uniref:(northern house mosquito) hypothetical protein n=1 Tax=Culex pipiens TaxID=7175 RepID=A0A8D8BTD9_CULPI
MDRGEHRYRTPRTDNLRRKNTTTTAQRKGDYVPSESRRLPVHALTKEHYTENKRNIFRFLKEKRKRQAKNAVMFWMTFPARNPWMKLSLIRTWIGWACREEAEENATDLGN